MEVEMKMSSEQENNTKMLVLAKVLTNCFSGTLNKEFFVGMLEKSFFSLTTSVSFVLINATVLKHASYTLYYDHFRFFMNMSRSLVFTIV